MEDQQIVIMIIYLIEDCSNSWVNLSSISKQCLSGESWIVSNHVYFVAYKPQPILLYQGQQTLFDEWMILQGEIEKASEKVRRILEMSVIVPCNGIATRLYIYLFGIWIACIIMLR